MFVKCSRNVFALLAIAVAVCWSEPVTTSTTTTSPSDEPESCEAVCGNTYPEHTYPDGKHLNACKQGCKYFTECGYNAVENDWNATHKACVNECSTAYPESNLHYACCGGCKTQFDKARKDKDKKESDGSQLSLIMFVQRIYETVVYHFCRILRRTFLAVYLQKDTGNLVVVRGEMRPVQILDPHAGESLQQQSDAETSTAAATSRTPEPTPVQSASGNNEATVQQDEPSTMSSSWLDCISRQSGIPQWLLMLVLFLVVVTMVWLCCATMVSSPTPQQQPPPYSAQKMGVNGDLDYLLMYDPSEQIKIQPPQDQEAPPLPVKIPLNQI
ncbi:unnamed protein product [Ixodes hexagonus]